MKKMAPALTFAANRRTGEGMARLAACNMAGILWRYSLWQKSDILPFLENDPPREIPSIVNAAHMGL